MQIDHTIAHHSADAPLLDGARERLELNGFELAIWQMLRAQGEGNDVASAAVHATRAEQEGHSFIELDSISADALMQSALVGTTKSLANAADFSGKALVCLQEADARTRVFLRRLWKEEAELAVALRERLRASHDATLRDVPALTSCPHWLSHELYALADAKLELVVLTGGPGTGKTTAAAKLALASLLNRAEHAREFALIAPTGKAAARLSEAFQQQLSALSLDEPNLVRQLTNTRATTLHQFLGVNPALASVEYHRNAFHSADVVLLDEASMVSSNMLLKLLHALRPSSKLILLGDALQLSAIESGSPLRDVLGFCRQRFAGVKRAEPATGDSQAPLSHGPSVMLRKQWRSNRKVADLANALLQVEWQLSSPEQAAREFEAVRKDINDHQIPEHFLSNWRALSAQSSASDALQVAQRFRILCAVHLGFRGQQLLNQRIEHGLRAQLRTRELHYRGRLLMATRNLHALGVLNGDVGICWPDPQGRMRWHLPGADGLASFLPQQVPGLVPAYALTVHKAQGSEFEHVAFVLPEGGDDDENKACYRALLYTAITRAKENVEIFGSDTALLNAIRTQSERRTTLSERLDLDS
jgi:exodeoxyribonuclease V alpha subunit